MAFIVLFVLKPMLQSIMKGAPVSPLAEARIGAEMAAEEYARQAAEGMRAQPERPMTETELAKQMARADAKQFADILRNWIK
jgi:flagellar biosynthesis/type III secretory pathway M-ring protein FliF/YscJ